MASVTDWRRDVDRARWSSYWSLKVLGTLSSPLALRIQRSSGLRVAQITKSQQHCALTHSWLDLDCEYAAAPLRSHRGRLVLGSVLIVTSVTPVKCLLAEKREIIGSMQSIVSRYISGVAKGKVGAERKKKKQQRHKTIQISWRRVYQ